MANEVVKLVGGFFSLSKSIFSQLALTTFPKKCVLFVFKVNDFAPNPRGLMTQCPMPDLWWTVQNVTANPCWIVSCKNKIIIIGMILLVKSDLPCRIPGVFSSGSMSWNLSKLFEMVSYSNGFSLVFKVQDSVTHFAIQFLFI